MSVKRIIPCLDIRNGQVIKGQRFENLKDLADPVDLARRYVSQGADELVFYDVTASLEGRRFVSGLLEAVAREVPVPLTVGGGVKGLEDIEAALRCGADKVSINSGAIKNPDLIREAAGACGSGRVVLGVDVKRAADGWHVYRDGGKADTGMDAVSWIRRCVALGAGEVVVNSIDMDGMKQGFDLALLSQVTEAVEVPVVASGGAGSAEDFIRLFRQVPRVSAGLAASVFHFGELAVPDLKRALRDAGIPVRREDEHERAPL